MRLLECLVGLEEDHPEVRGGQTSSHTSPLHHPTYHSVPSKSQTHGTCLEATLLETRSIVQVSTKTGQPEDVPFVANAATEEWP